jgi:hypothetical protein
MELIYLAVLALFTLQAAQLFYLSKLRSETRMAFLFGNTSDEDGDETEDEDEIEGENEDGDVVFDKIIIEPLEDLEDLDAAEVSDNPVLAGAGGFKPLLGETDAANSGSCGDMRLAVNINGPGLHREKEIGTDELIELQCLFDGIKGKSQKIYYVSVTGPDYFGLETSKCQLVNSDHIDEVLALLGLNKEDEEWLC